jgi:hypothetical protein
MVTVTGGVNFAVIGGVDEGVGADVAGVGCEVRVSSWLYSRLPWAGAETAKG